MAEDNCTAIPIRPDLDMDELNMLLTDITTVSDLLTLASTHGGDLLNDTVANGGWLILELTRFRGHLIL